MLADADEVETDLVGQQAFLDDVADHLGMVEGAPVGSLGDTAERVDAELDIRS